MAVAPIAFCRNSGGRGRNLFASGCRRGGTIAFCRNRILKDGRNLFPGLRRCSILGRRSPVAEGVPALAPSDPDDESCHDVLAQGGLAHGAFHIRCKEQNRFPKGVGFIGGSGRQHRLARLIGGYCLGIPKRHIAGIGQLDDQGVGV